VSSRQIFKGHGKAHREVEALLQSVLITELLSPSEVLWLISPWVSDVAILDNRTGALAGVEPTWGRRQITMVEVLAAVVRKGALLVVATREDSHNRRFIDRLGAAVEADGNGGRVAIRQSDQANLHAKGLLGDDYYLSGSMNFTESGIRINDEAVKFDISNEVVAQARVHFRQDYGTP
jgi:phosphatidylserine/phosphatidylglycerophosphate/cardiolipin synthase-like enzyme